MSMEVLEALVLSETKTIRLAMKCHCCGVVHEFEATLMDAKRDASRERKRVGWHRTHDDDGRLVETCGDCMKHVKGSYWKSRYVPTGGAGWHKSRVNVTEAVELYNGGATLADLAVKYGVTRERVRQKITRLVDHERTKPAKCKGCGAEFRQGPGSPVWYCSDKCRNEAVKQGLRSDCVCGNKKMRNAGRCKKCSSEHSRTFDYALAAHLYDRGATAKQVAKVLKLIPITVAMAVNRAGCPKHGRGFRATLTIPELRGMAAEFRKSKKESAK